ncbi:hypothetical protein PoB_002532500 [Plakobranchus ocellatus]|uniref:Neurotransmitter-gated ion-channel transmembrane domain-containing protein n=1 Tax=Plakobranchus ocellatus TaxID=259542 RepID=A0AAV3ZUJ4_9GAST|nr:hypothetical protein PoB_002532500 [Plakobranchus ocellatus]
MLPRSSESMPLMVRYIFCLLIISVLTVVDSIIIVRIHHMEQEQKGSCEILAKMKAPVMNSLQLVSTQDHLTGLTEERESSPATSTSSQSEATDIQADCQVHRHCVSHIVYNHLDGAHHRVYCISSNVKRY